MGPVMLTKEASGTPMKYSVRIPTIRAFATDASFVSMTNPAFGGDVWRIGTHRL
jgi:hypothetical protein